MIFLFFDEILINKDMSTRKELSYRPNPPCSTVTLIFTMHVTLKVIMSVRPSVRYLKYQPKGYLTCVTAPAYPPATDVVVYTAFMT